MNLGDPQLELIDPTPNVHSLFLHFDKVFFWTKLASRAVVRWSKRMYSCAGVCSYEGYGGLCDIALSEPLLKLRPRKDLVETLLHEMIHAYLFISNRDRDRDGHGPNFQAHMHRINRCAGLNISIYHDFHDEVKLYQTHWWRCNGPCQTLKPYFGIVRRTANRAPSNKDYWWEQHKRNCGGTFVKIKEPQQYPKKVAGKKEARKKPNADITKYVNSNKKTSVGDNDCPNSRGVLKDSNNIPSRIKSNSSNTVIVTKKGVVYNPQPIVSPVFNGTGKVIGNVNDLIDGRKRSNSVDVMETVRNVWANIKLPTAPRHINNNKPTQKVVSSNVLNNNKHKSDNVHVDSPPSKIKKIDDYFKTAATVLKDLYGQDFDVTKSKNENKLVALPVKKQINALKQDVVDCPVCSTKVIKREINRHLDECLNKEVIRNLCNDNLTATCLLNLNIKNENDTVSSIKTEYGISASVSASDMQCTPNYDVIETEKANKTECWTPIFVNNDFNIAKESANKDQLNKRIHSIDLTNIDPVINSNNNVTTKKPKPEVFRFPTFDDNYMNRAREISNQIEKNKGSSDDLKILNCINFNSNKTETNNHFYSTIDDNSINRAREISYKIKEEKQLRKSGSFIFGFKDNQDMRISNIKTQPGTSKDIVPKLANQNCPCCDRKVNKPIEEHLDECLAFFDNNTTIPEEGASTSFANQAIVVIDDDNDIFDESLTLNATGTKYPCPCCLEMVEQAEMNEHLDNCLS